MSYINLEVVKMKNKKLTLRSISINVPEKMIEFTKNQNESEELTRNAMILFPYIRNETISYGKAAQILGIHKLDLIAIYSTLGISYIEQTKEELENDIAVLKKLRNSVI